VKKLILVLVALLACLSSPALARDDGDDVRARGDRACNGDARRLCRPFLSKGDMAVLHCFQSNRKRLSGSCARFLREVGQL
jgi:hypothetical protein